MLISRVEMIDLVSIKDDRIPIVSTFFAEFKSKHSSKDFVKVFSGDDIIGKRSIEVLTKATSSLESEAALKK